MERPSKLFKFGDEVLRAQWLSRCFGATQIGEILVG
jgi:hypothetical protein